MKKLLLGLAIALFSLNFSLTPVQAAKCVLGSVCIDGASCETDGKTCRCTGNCTGENCCVQIIDIPAIG